MARQTSKNRSSKLMEQTMTSNDMAATKLVYLNGEYLAPQDAKISVFDRGFIFGDGIYEYVPVFGRRLFRLAHHLQRLETSLREVHIPNPLTAAQWREVFERLIAS